MASRPAESETARAGTSPISRVMMRRIQGRVRQFSMPSAMTWPLKVTVTEAAWPAQSRPRAKRKAGALPTLSRMRAWAAKRSPEERRELPFGSWKPAAATIKMAELCRVSASLGF
jgi:hypothetical protein